MHYKIDAELTSARFHSPLKVTIISGNNRTLVTSIPDKDGETVFFDENEPVRVSYYHGEFVYSFALLYRDKIVSEKETFYEYTIDEVTVDNNYRKHKRELVDFKGLIMNTGEMVYVKVLDISLSGMKIESEMPINKRKIEVHYADGQNETKKAKGKIVWSKKVSDTTFHYGLKF